MTHPDPTPTVTEPWREAEFAEARALLTRFVEREDRCFPAHPHATPIKLLLSRLAALEARAQPATFTEEQIERTGLGAAEVIACEAEARARTGPLAGMLGDRFAQQTARRRRGRRGRVMQTQSPEAWRETVRAIYDELHHGGFSIFTGNQLARRLVELIEERHHGYFCEAAQPPSPPEGAVGNPTSEQKQAVIKVAKRLAARMGAEFVETRPLSPPEGEREAWNANLIQGKVTVEDVARVIEEPWVIDQYGATASVPYEIALGKAARIALLHPEGSPR